MTDPRWQQISALYHDALAREPGERGAYLREACKGDEVLEQEVASLLAHDAGEAFVDTPALAAVAQALVAPPAGSLVGRRLGPYQVIALLGAGGMGEVYRARDTTLGRDVAIKTLPEGFAPDAAHGADRLARFQREAQTLASLNHPNIAIVHGLEHAGHVHALVMELVEGEDLSARMARGAMPPDESLPIARQIADALEAAHALGIVHRDLKPANIKVRADGTVKVLDFGLAKLSAAQPPIATPADSPTFGVARTEAGVILGTAGYMSPEQARGEVVDKRADVWAFGVVLWEMLTGKRLFQRKTGAETLAAVIHDEPDVNKAPSKVRPLLRRCLEKDPRRRLRDIGDAMAIIEQTPESPAGAARQWAGWAAAIALLIPLGALSWIYVHQQAPPEPQLIRFQIPAPSDTAPLGLYLAISPDGRKLAFTYQGRLWVHSLDTGESRDLTAATETATPFWSPTSRFIGFLSDGQLKKIEATGGPAQTVCALAAGWGMASWNQDDVIVVGSQRGPIFQVPAAGGVPVPVTQVDPSREEQTHIEPWFLPDGRHFVYVRLGTETSHTYYIGSLDAKPNEQSTKPLLTAASGMPVYAPSADPRTGYLLFTREGTLMAQPFDNGKRELTGQPGVVAEQLGVEDALEAFSVSANGALVFQRVAANSQLTWFDQQGKALGTVGDPAPYSEIRLSPDGTQAATVRGSPNSDIWLVEFARGTSTRLTSDAVNKGNPVWSPDGTRIAFRQRGIGLVLKPSNGIGAPELLLKSDLDVYPINWSRDGHFLLYSVFDPKTRSDIWVLPLVGDRKPAVLLNTEFNERSATFSPDGRWIAYTSDESGRNETYVRPFEAPSGNGAPTVGARRIVSIGGAGLGGWLDGGKALDYGSTDGKIMVVEMSTSPVFRVGAPQLLFQIPKGYVAADRTADAKRFLFAMPVGKTSSEPYSVVLNWPALLKR